jgi:two-component system, LytTR family, response regulator
MNAVRCLVIDDEPLSRDLLRRFVSEEPQLQLVGEAATGEAALRLIAESKPDLLFLDVQMPEMSGFDVLDALPRGSIPVTVFVTAYDTYAMRAFDAQALDYLLKPFDRERFHRSVLAAVERIGSDRKARYAEKLEKMLAERKGKRILIRSDGRLIPVRAADIHWVEAEGNYVRVHIGKSEHLIRATLREFAEKLPSSSFVRIHRSALVNVAQVSEVEPWYTGEYVVRLLTGRELTLSRTYRDAFFEALGRAS